MPTRLNPYLSFRDNAREAMTFYQSVFGGKLDMNSFADFNMADDPADKDKVMHSQLETPNGMTLMGSDTPSSVPYDPGNSISISLSGENAAESELRGYWDKLIAGGQVTVPLEKAPWGDTFGMLTDKFGINWMVNIAGTQQ